MTLTVPHHVLMVRPAGFGANPETRDSNAFQYDQELPGSEIQAMALREFDTMVAQLEANDIRVLVVQDTLLPVKPDALFPNNWLSMQPDGKLVTYPMLAANRRLERRDDVLELIRNSFQVTEELNFAVYEEAGQIVEGTGSLVFDHKNRIAYASLSPRTDASLATVICSQLGYSLVLFDARDEAGQPVYHTNVIMAVATDFALVSLDTIGMEEDRERVIDSLRATGHTLIAISFDQVKSFACNALEVMKTTGERILVVSETAVQSLLPGQLNAITKYVDILPVRIPTIEKYGGGSVRCMLAGIHLPERAG